MYAERIGTLATVFVRRAVAKGCRGTCESRTYEGLENYTAYVTSDVSGWSAHVAVNCKLSDSPRFWLFIVLVGGLAGDAARERRRHHLRLPVWAWPRSQARRPRRGQRLSGRWPRAGRAFRH